MAHPYPHFDRRYPDFASLRQRARTRLPKFAFDFVDTGAGRETGLRRNYDAFDRIEMTPRFGGEIVTPDLRTELFGETYAMPVGIAPMGLTGIAWPGSDEILAAGAQAAGIPYVMATGSSMAIEAAPRLVPNRFWFQLYKIAGNQGRIQDDLIARAQRAGAKVLVLTVDSSARASRPRDMRNGLVPPFSMSASMVMQAAFKPSWSMALLRAGVPTFRNILPYVEGSKTPWAAAAFTVREVSGAFTWAEVEAVRRKWPHALVVKGISHPQDALLALRAGADAVWISNHGGRIFDPAPATIDMLPQVREAVGPEAKIFLDSGIRDGIDVVRALSLGADFCFAGRAFLFSVAALGAGGASHMATAFANEITNSLKFLGNASISDFGRASARAPASGI